MSKWKTCKIKDLGVVVTGNTPPTSKREYYGEKYVFIKPTDITEGERYVIKTEERFSELGAQKFRNAMLLPFTPCMVTIGSLGKKMCMTNQLSFTNQAINAVLVNNENDNFYVYYLLKTLLPTVKFLSNGTASGRENVSKSSFENIDISVPHLTIQKRAASILAIYDDLIENNNRRIAILEEMAQKLYREWFVHFRFPGHENVKMVESEMGMIPEGWKVGSLADIADNIKKSVKKIERERFQYYVPIDCLPRKTITLSEAKSVSEAESSLIEFRENDILMGAMRAYFHKVICVPFDGITRSTCFVLRPKCDFYHSYLLMTIFQESSIEYASTISVGATMPYVVWDTFSRMEVLIPAKDIVKKYNDIVNPIVQQLQGFFFKNTNLRKTRDLLLPRLISGDIDVSELDIPIKEG